MKPYDFQVEDLDRIEEFKGRALVAWDPGLGKTNCSLWWLGRHKDDASPAVVVCPASIKCQWAKEAEKVLGVKPQVLEGTRPGKRLPLADLIVVNFDILTHWLKVLTELPIRTLIIDECQKISNLKAKRTMACHALAKGVPYVLGLSATPMENRTIEMYSILKMLKPREFRSRWKFIERYCNPQMTPWGWKYDGASNTRELHDKLMDLCMVRRRKVDVLDQFPLKVRTVIPLPMKAPAEYRKANSYFLEWLEEWDKGRARKAERSQGLTKVGYLVRLAARLKMRYVVEWINEFLERSDEKLVVFAIHAGAIDSLRRNCKGKSVVIDGSTSSKKRIEAVKQFRSDSEVRLFIGNLRAAGVGLDGLQVARNVCFAELPWQPGLALQGEDRAWRIGTESTVWVRYFVAADTIEEKLCKVLQKKQEILTAVLDGRKVKNNFDILDKLLSGLRDKGL